MWDAPLYVTPVFVHDVYESGVRPDQRRDARVLSRARAQFLGKQHGGRRRLSDPFAVFVCAFGATHQEFRFCASKGAGDPLVPGTVIFVAFVDAGPSPRPHPAATDSLVSPTARFRVLLSRSIGGFAAKQAAAPERASTVTSRMEGTLMAIKAVVLDIGGVLEHVQDDAWHEIWIGRWARRMNLPADQVVAALAVVEPIGDVVTGAISETQMRERYARALGLFRVG